MAPLFGIHGASNRQRLPVGAHSGLDHAMTEATSASDELRIDKWLWCTRFFKSRSQATQAVVGGLVHVGGERVKPSRAVHVGDVVQITRGDMRWVVIVQSIPMRRGPAPEAQTHYTETPESAAERERRRDRLRAAPAPDGRPDKHARRELRNLRQRNNE
jgi:ribosome-associated heat shock protein Hsp15